MRAKYYSASASTSNPNTYVGVPNTVTVTLTNDPLTSTQSFGSAELTFNSLPPSAVTSLSVSTSGWSGSVLPNSNPAVVLLTSQKGHEIQPGSSLTVQVTLTPTATGTITIGTEVKQSNDFSGSGNDFILEGSEPTITVTPLTLDFVQQPPATVQQSIAPTGSFSYFCPPVSVQLYNGSTPVDASGVPVTINYAGSSDPGLYYGSSKVTSSGVTVTTDSNGLATFGTCSSGLAATNIGAGYALSASSPAATTSATSNTFEVVQFQFSQTCNKQTCTTPTLQSQSTGTTATVTAISSSASSYQFSASFGEGVSLTCDSSVTTTAADPLVTDTSQAATGKVTMTFPKAVVNSVPNNGTPLMPVCAGATQPFAGSNTTPLSSTAYPYQGLLQDCPSDYLSVTTFELCVVSRAKIGGGAERIVIYGSDISDPSFW
jgi:hypothetical protein